MWWRTYISGGQRRTDCLVRSRGVRSAASGCCEMAADDLVTCWADQGCSKAELTLMWLVGTSKLEGGIKQTWECLWLTGPCASRPHILPKGASVSVRCLQSFRHTFRLTDIQVPCFILSIYSQSCRVSWCAGCRRHQEPQRLTNGVGPRPPLPLSHLSESRQPQTNPTSTNDTRYPTFPSSLTYSDLPVLI